MGVNIPGLGGVEATAAGDMVPAAYLAGSLPA